HLATRVTVRCYLVPLNPEDTTRYIYHRLSVAASQGLARFHPKSYGPIHKYSKGIPRRINSLCDRALLLAYARGMLEVRPEFIHQANKELIGDFPGAGPRLTWLEVKFSRLIPALFAVLALLLVFIWAYFRLEEGWP
ncbi:MAG: hypothetical protein HQK55_13010, partial [Deltaproteobacteria bacterium]|nr:hypothetical protein [Deltaproteobacteria bacterium]